MIRWYYFHLTSNDNPVHACEFYIVPWWLRGLIRLIGTVKVDAHNSKFRACLHLPPWIHQALDPPDEQ